MKWDATCIITRPNWQALTINVGSAPYLAAAKGWSRVDIWTKYVASVEQPAIDGTYITRSELTVCNGRFKYVVVSVSLRDVWVGYQALLNSKKIVTGVAFTFIIVSIIEWLNLTCSKLLTQQIRSNLYNLIKIIDCVVGLCGLATTWTLGQSLVSSKSRNFEKK